MVNENTWDIEHIAFNLTFWEKYYIRNTVTKSLFSQSLVLLTVIFLALVFKHGNELFPFLIYKSIPPMCPLRKSLTNFVNAWPIKERFPFQLPMERNKTPFAKYSEQVLVVHCRCFQDTYLMRHNLLSAKCFFLGIIIIIIIYVSESS